MIRKTLLAIASAACLLAAAPTKPFQHPPVFEPNKGQFAAPVKWAARGDAFQLLLSEDGATFQMTEGAVKMKLTGGRRWSSFQASEPTGGVTNYMFGNDPRQWQTGIQHFNRVRVAGVYEGIDLVFYNNGKDLEYDFAVAPGADPNQIRLSFDGVERMQVDNVSGELVLATRAGQLRHGRPRVFQKSAAGQTEVAGRYRINGMRQAEFTLAAYDRARPLTIDPTLKFQKTFLGVGTRDYSEVATGVALDPAGNTWVTGHSSSYELKVHSVVGNAAGDNQLASRTCRDHRTDEQSHDVFIAKMAPDGNLMVLSFLGDCELDMGNAIAADATGAYVTGYTESKRFPVINSLQPLNGADAFILKVDPSGKLVYSTFLGGPSIDSGFAIAVDSNANAYVAGKTYTEGFPVTANAMQRTFGGTRDAFVAKLNPTGTALVYATYLGGAGYDEGNGIAVDSQGNAYITGMTESQNFPTRAAAQLWPFGPSAFVTKLNPQGSAMVYSTYLGGGADAGNAIAVDSMGNAFVTGTTSAASFPTSFDAYQIAKVSGVNADCAFLTQFSPTGQRTYSTFFSARDGQTSGRAIGINPADGSVYIGGMTTSMMLPASSAVNTNGQVGYFTRFQPGLSQISYSYMFLSGSQINDLAVQNVPGQRRPIGDISAVGFTSTGKTSDGFVIRLSEE